MCKKDSRYRYLEELPRYLRGKYKPQILLVPQMGTPSHAAMYSGGVQKVKTELRERQKKVCLVQVTG